MGPAPRLADVRAILAAMTKGEGERLDNGFVVEPPVMRQLEVRPDLTEARPGDLVPGGLNEQLRIRADVAAGLDLRDSRFLEVLWDGADLDGTQLAGSRIIDSRMRRVTCPTLDAFETTWRTVAVADCRMGAVELHRSDLQGVEFADCRFDYVNLRGASLSDVLLRGCTIDELDLSFASVHRVLLRNCTVRRLSVARAEVANLDLCQATIAEVDDVAALSGAIISRMQLIQLSAAMAGHLGIHVS